MRLPIGKTILFLTVPGVVVLDVANGLLGRGAGLGGLPLTPGELGRSLLLLAGLYYIAVLRGSHVRRLQAFFLVLLAIGSMGPLYAILRGGNLSAFIFDLEQLSKVLYGPALIVLFTYIILRFRLTGNEVFEAVAWWGAIAGSGMIVFGVLGIGSATYGEYASGFKGLFLAQNDLGLGMLVSLAASTHLAVRAPRIRNLSLVALTIGGALTLGTRTALLGAFLVPLACIAVSRPRVRTWSQALRYGTLALAALLALGLVAQQRVRTIRSETYQMEKFSRLLSGDFTRVVLLAGAVEYTSERPLASTFVGDGPHRYQVGVARALTFREDRSLAEVDWIDFFGAYGVFFVLAAYLFYLSLLSGTRALVREGESGTAWIIRIMLGVYLVHSILAGHALASPLPTGVLAPALAVAWIADRRVHGARGRATDELDAPDSRARGAGAPT